MAIPLARFESMDPYILLSAVNMILRDESLCLEELCKREEISKDSLVAKLAGAGFSYDETLRQFK